MPSIAFPSPFHFPFSLPLFPCLGPPSCRGTGSAHGAVPEPSTTGSLSHLQTLFPGCGASCPCCLLSLRPLTPLGRGQTSLVPPLLLFWALCLSKKTAQCKSLQRAHPALFMLAAGPFALFYPASLIQNRDFFGLKKSAVFPLLPPPSPAPWKFR